MFWNQLTCIVFSVTPFQPMAQVMKYILNTLELFFKVRIGLQEFKILYLHATQIVVLDR